MENPKHHNLEDEDGPEGKEIVLKHYNIKKNWNFGTKDGSLFITNHRLLYERFDGEQTLSIPHGVVDYARGSNNGGFFGTAGMVSLCFRDGKTHKILCDIGEEVVNYLNSTIYTDEVKKKRKIAAAKRHERLLEFDEAVEIYKKLGKDEEVIRVRKEQRNKVNIDQTVVHGDYVDDRDTIVKDSVINRSNIGAGGSSKLQEIKELKELLDSGAIDDDEFKQMKKEILGK